MIWVSVIASLLTVVDFISIWLKTLKTKTNQISKNHRFGGFYFKAS